MNNIGITVFSCEQDEATAFYAAAKKLGASPVIIDTPVSPKNAVQANGNRCISVGHKSKICAQSLAALQNAGVRYICSRSIGINHINIAAANKMGLTVEGITYSPDSVADYTVMLMLMAIRGAKQTLIGCNTGNYRLNETRGKELRDMTVGVIGAGRIGTATIQRLCGFGCKILCYDITQSQYSVPLNTLLRESDIITLHIPLKPQTHHLIAENQFAIMKHGAYLINTGRGALVNTKALINALERGKLSGAALDVLEGEEDVFYRHKKPALNTYVAQLQNMPNVIITPHTAYYTTNALQDTVRNTIINCINFRSTHSELFIPAFGGDKPANFAQGNALCAHTIKLEKGKPLKNSLIHTL